MSETASTKYPSLFSPKKHVSAAQYISELVCHNNAQKNNIDLHDKFWNEQHWRSFYIWQIKHANTLLDKYEASVVIKFIQDSKIWNLSAKWVDVELAKLQQNKPKVEEKEFDITENPTFQKSQDKNMDFLDG